MARREIRSERIGIVKKVYDVKGGMVSNFPAEEIPDNKANFIKNMVSDRRNVLRKTWGTQELITGGTNEAYNKFITNPVYSFYDFTTPDGFSTLITQGKDASDGYISLYTLPARGEYPSVETAAPTRILGASAELTAKRRLTYATYKGRMYIWNGIDYLRYWNSNTWKVYHVNNSERFRYLCTHGQRLWAAGSGANPSRLIYTDLNHCNFYHYFSLDANSIDFASAKDYSPIMWICEFKDSLLIFKVNSIYRLWGNPEDVINFDCISQGVGTINGWSIQVWKELVYFVWTDGVYALGDASVVASLEDRKLQIQSNIIRISSEIDDYWEDNFVLPNPYKLKEQVWSGATDFGDFTLTTCQANTASVTENPDVINASFVGTASKAESEETTSGANWVDLRSDLGDDQYFAQGIRISSPDEPMPHSVKLYLENNGTLTTTQKLKVQITSVTGEDPYEPYYDKIYAEASYDLDGVTTAGWYTITFDYWDYPKSFWGLGLVFIVVKAVGDTDALYVKWHYATGNPYANGQMVNSDDATPGTQSDKDYTFQLYTNEIWTNSWVQTDSYEAAESTRQEWGTVNFNLDETGGRNMKLHKLEYNLSADDSTWDGWVEVENGAYLGVSCAVNKYIKFKAQFTRSTGSSEINMDSFTLVSIRLTYTTQDFDETLIDSVIYKDNYILSVHEVKTATTGDCLKFDGSPDYVTVADDATLDPGTNDLAMVFDVKFRASQQTQEYVWLIAKESSQAQLIPIYGVCALDRGSGYLYIPIRDVGGTGNLLQSNVALDIGDNNWHKIIVSYDRSDKAYVFVDGVAKGQSGDMSAWTAYDLSSDEVLCMGTNHPSIGSVYGGPFVGYMDNIMFYKRTIGQTEATWLSANPGEVYSDTNLELHLKMNEGTGNTTYDETDNDNDGELGGASHVTAAKPEWAVR